MKRKLKKKTNKDNFYDRLEKEASIVKLQIDVYPKQLKNKMEGDMKKLLLALLLLGVMTGTALASYWWQDVNGNWHESESGTTCWRDVNGNYHCN